METLLKSECKEKWKPPKQKNIQITLKTAELPFANLKQNMHLTEFKTTGLKQVNTEFKLYATGHNLKRIRKIKKPGKQKSIKKICVPSSF